MFTCRLAVYRVLPLFLVFIWAGLARGDGIIIPPPGAHIAVKYHHVTVTIDNQVATSRVEQAFLNDSEMDSLEGTYLFPLPKDAAISRFTMLVDGQEVTAELLDADSARAIYEQIVRIRQDPGLLEYIGQGLFQARVFPIRAGEAKPMSLSYTELLPFDNGLIRYVYGLSAEQFSSRPLEAVSVTVEIKSADPIGTIYSPSHEITVERIDDYNARVTYAEEEVIPNQDFILYYTVTSNDIGIHLLTHRSSGEPGFYLLMASPRQTITADQVVKKRLLFVLDRSGSMRGDKIEQAKNALKFGIQTLNPGDRFNVIDFSTQVTAFRDETVPADATHLADALAYVDAISALGGTHIHQALLTAMRQTEADSLANIVVFLTDGRPTVGVVDNQQIMADVGDANRHNARLFVFGLGFDVNTHLLDGLAQENQGTSAYVRPNEDIEGVVSSFFSKITNPVLTDLSVDFGSINVSEPFPQQLPDLFQGSQVVQFGRFTSQGNTTITLSGTVNGQAEDYTLEAYFPAAADEYLFVPRLWAIRKVGYLLDLIRLNGESQELVDEIVVLSKRYGIVTPYTSFLILEDQPPGVNLTDLLGADSGEAAVTAASDMRSYRDANSPQRIRSDAVRYVNGKAFFLIRDFWIDSQYLEDQPTTILTFGSDDYFQILQEEPQLAPYFALGRNLIVSMGTRAYQVQEEGEEYIPPLPRQHRLFQNYPNPFNPETTIRFTIVGTRSVYARLGVYNILGQEIRRLVEARFEPGVYEVTWDGRDDQGALVGSGIYLYRLRVGRVSETRKMVLVK